MFLPALFILFTYFKRRVFDMRKRRFSISFTQIHNLYIQFVFWPILKVSEVTSYDHLPIKGSTSSTFHTGSATYMQLVEAIFLVKSYIQCILLKSTMI